MARQKRIHIALTASDHKIVEKFARERKLAKTRAIIEAINEAQEYAEIKAKLNSSAFDKAFWYSMKLAFSVQALKDIVADGINGELLAAQMQRLREVCKQIADRIGVDCESLLSIAKQYADTRSKDDLILLNEATKEVAKEVFKKLILEG